MLRSSEGVAVGRFASERGPLDGIGWEPRSQPDETRLPAGPLAPQANQETSRDNQARRREEPMVRIYLPPEESELSVPRRRSPILPSSKAGCYGSVCVT